MVKLWQKFCHEQNCGIMHVTLVKEKNHGCSCQFYCIKHEKKKKEQCCHRLCNSLYVVNF